MNHKYVIILYIQATAHYLTCKISVPHLTCKLQHRISCEYSQNFASALLIDTFYTHNFSYMVLSYDVNNLSAFCISTNVPFSVTIL